MSIGQPFIINACPKVSSNWFPQKERIVATSVAAYANIFGVAVGCFVPSIFFEDNDINLPDEAKKHSLTMNLYLAGIATVVLLLSIILFKDKPLNALHKNETGLEQASMPVMQAMWILVKDKSFVFSVLSHSMIIGFFFSFTTVLEQMIKIYDFTSLQASYLSSAFQFAGIVSGILCSLILTKKGPKSFKGASLIIIGMTILCNL